MNSCLQKIKSGDFENISCDEVDFVQVVAEKKARIYQSQIKKTGPLGTT